MWAGSGDELIFETDPARITNERGEIQNEAEIEIENEGTEVAIDHY